MLNSIEAYQDAGRKAAQARNDRDEARASFTKNWFGRAKALESEANKPLAQAAFDEGYKEARRVPNIHLG